jgi:hypothetical protein
LTEPSAYDRALGADGFAPHGKAHVLQHADVAYPSIDDQRLRTARHEAGSQQVAEIAVSAFRRDPCNNHIVGPDLFGRHVLRPVVTWLQQYGHCGAGNERAWIDRPHVRLHQADTPHRLMYGNASELFEMSDDRGVGTHSVLLDDAELIDQWSSHGQIPFVFRAASRRGKTRRALPS